MTLIRLALGVVAAGGTLVVAIVLLNEAGWRSWVPAILMCLQLLKVEDVAAPQPYLVAAAVAACIVVVFARAPRLRSLRLAGVIICTLSTTTLQLTHHL
jgi:hypothetical protein